MTIVNGGKNYDTVLSNTCAPFQIQKMPGLHRKCTISSYSLDVCQATKWQKWKLKVNLSLHIIKNDAIRTHQGMRAQIHTH